MRVTPNILSQQAILNFQRSQTKFADLQDQIATGKRIRRPSDDPVGAAVVARNKSDDRSLDAFIKNIDDTNITLNVSVNSLRDAHTTLAEVQNLLVQAADGTVEDDVFATYAADLDNYINRMLKIANSEFNGEHLFGGTSADSAPFVVAATDANGRPTRIVYRGTSEDSEILVGENTTTKSLLAGDRVFQQRNRGTTQFVTGSTGVTAGTGTDSATGTGTLIVAHTLTTYGGASGIAAGTSSAAGDTILGLAGTHTLAINDVAKTISLNGATAVSYTGTETDLLVTGANGERVYVNTTGITANFIGSENIASTGTVSTDGGLTTTAINFSANQVITNSVTGGVTNINSTNIRRTGTETVDYAGTHDVFEILIAVRDQLRNLNNLPEGDRRGILRQRISDLERVRSGMLDILGEQATSAENLDSLRNRSVDIQEDLKLFISDREDADIAQAVVNLQIQQNLFQSGLTIAARINNLSLADFLR